MATSVAVKDDGSRLIDLYKIGLKENSRAVVANSVVDWAWTNTGPRAAKERLRGRYRVYRDSYIRSPTGSIGH
jgi:hypothetical protein